MEDRSDSERRSSHLGALAQQVRIDRRRITQMMAATVGVLAPGRGSAQTIERNTAQLSRDLTGVIARPLIRQVRRADDLLVLDYRFQNLRVTDGGTGPVVEKVNTGRPGILVVTHQPQSIIEEVFWQRVEAAKNTPLEGQEGNPPATNEEPPAPPIRPYNRIAGPSRIAYQMPPGMSRARWGLSGLLDACRTWPMRLDPLAKPPPPRRVSLLLKNQLSSQIAEQRLNAAAGTLLSSLPDDQQAELADSLSAASARAADRMERALRGSGTISDADIDRIVGEELDNALSRPSVAQTTDQRRRTVSALEAASAVRLAEMLRTRNGNVTLDASEAVVPELDGRAFAVPLLASTTPHEPSGSVTAIELPYRMIQTPLATAGWSHAASPVEHNERTEIWHTRLGTRGDAGVDDQSSEPLRAIWTPDYPVAKSTRGSPPRVAIYGDDRQALVRLTSGFNERNAAGESISPRPVDAEQLILTPLGASLKLKGGWEPAEMPGAKDGMPEVAIESWTHKTALGRDYFVRIVKTGYLYPVGHRASLVEITERKFENRVGDNSRMATLRKRAFIIVRERVKRYSGFAYEYEGRELPFSRIEILTQRTPDLAPPGEVATDRLTQPPETAFYPIINGAGPVRFDMVATDISGRAVPFSAPLVLVLKGADAGSESQKEQFYTDLRRFYLGEDDDGDNNQWSSTNQERSTIPLRGATVQYAPQFASGDLDGDTNIPTVAMRLEGFRNKSADPLTEAGFLPRMRDAEVDLPAVKNILGAEAVPRVVFNDRYLQSGFGSGGGGKPANDAAKMFLDLLDQNSPPGGGQPTDSFGGLINPDLTPSGLSRDFGLVSGNTFEQGNFDPTDFLPSAKLLGVIPLDKVLRAVTLATAGVGEAPKFKTIELPDEVRGVYTLDQDQLNPVSPIFEPLPNNRLLINTVVTVPISKTGSPGEPTATIDGEMVNFQINLFSCIVLTFDRLTFNAVPGKKPDVDVGLNPDHGVLFGGPLEFVNDLKDIIPLDGFADPSPIDISPTGISAGYVLSLPAVQVGVCSLSNISLGARFSLPFTGDPPSMRFNFAERESPFNLTVSLFGGGGFVAVVVDTGGVREIEMSIEFGARIEINLGVASGGVYVKAGFYFVLEKLTNEDRVRFEGFVELGGHLSILGLIKASLTFHLALGYQKGSPESYLFGQASLVVEVEVLFFSASVEVKVERRFAGSNADPLFIDFVPSQNIWREYCDAFA